MKSLPIDTIVKVKEYGIGIIVDVLYSSKLYRVSFQGEEHLIRFNDVIPYEDVNKKSSVKEISKCIYSNNKRKVIEKPHIRTNKPSTIESGDFVYNHIYGHGLVIRRIGDEDLFDCKFGKKRIHLKSEYLTKEDYVTSNNFYRTSPVQTKKPAIRNRGISHNLTRTNATLATNNEIGSVKYSKYAMTGDASNPANRQNTNYNNPKSSSEKTTSKPYQKKLMVKFPNGTIICNDDLEDTYIDALWEFDPDSIILNRICFNGISIITSENTKDGRVQVGVNQWAYVPTLITNIKKVLEIISTTLNIEVEIHEI